MSEPALQYILKLNLNINHSYLYFVCFFFSAVHSSASTSTSSSSDGSGHTYVQSNNDGQGQFQYTQSKPGGVMGPTIVGQLPPNPNQNPFQNPNQFYGPSNFGQPTFGVNYGPSFPYGTMQPPFTPYPQAPAFGFNSPFQPLPPYQPFQPFSSPLATPQEFTAYLNSIQQQYNAYVLFQYASLLLTSDSSVS